MNVMNSSCYHSAWSLSLDKLAELKYEPYLTDGWVGRNILPFNILLRILGCTWVNFSLLVVCEACLIHLKPTTVCSCRNILYISCSCFIQLGCETNNLINQQQFCAFHLHNLHCVIKEGIGIQYALFLILSDCIACYPSNKSGSDHTAHSRGEYGRQMLSLNKGERLHRKH